MGASGIAPNNRPKGDLIGPLIDAHMDQLLLFNIDQAGHSAITEETDPLGRDLPCPVCGAINKYEMMLASEGHTNGR